MSGGGGSLSRLPFALSAPPSPACRCTRVQMMEDCVNTFQCAVEDFGHILGEAFVDTGLTNGYEARSISWALIGKEMATFDIPGFPGTLIVASAPGGGLEGVILPPALYAAEEEDGTLTLPSGRELPIPPHRLPAGPPEAMALEAVAVLHRERRLLSLARLIR